MPLLRWLVVRYYASRRLVVASRSKCSIVYTSCDSPSRIVIIRVIIVNSDSLLFLKKSGEYLANIK